MERTSWAERKANEDVLKKMGEKRQLLKPKKMNWTCSTCRWVVEDDSACRWDEVRIDGKGSGEGKIGNVESELKEEGHANMKRSLEDRKRMQIEYTDTHLSKDSTRKTEGCIFPSNKEIGISTIDK